MSDPRHVEIGDGRGDRARIVLGRQAIRPETARACDPLVTAGMHIRSEEMEIAVAHVRQGGVDRDDILRLQHDRIHVLVRQEVADDILRTISERDEQFIDIGAHHQIR